MMVRPSQTILSQDQGWAHRFVSVSAAALSVTLGLAWIRQLYNLDGNGFFVQLLSFRVDDPPWMPADVPPSHALVGAHHFGDLTLALGYGLTGNPYISGLPSQTPPLGILIFRLMAFGGYQVGFSLFLLLSFFPLLLSGWLLLGRYRPSDRVTILSLACLATLGAVTSFDRGALALAVVGLFGCGLVLYQRQHWAFASLVMILAISVKPYMVFALLLFLFRGAWRFVILVVLVTLGVNLLLFAVFEGGWLVSIAGFLDGTRRYSGQSLDFAWVVLDGTSAIGGVSKALAAVWGPDIAQTIVLPNLSWVAPLSGLVWLALALPLLIARGVPMWVSSTVALAATMMVTPSSRVYTTAWACLAAVLYCAPLMTSAAQGDSRRFGRIAAMRVVVLIMILCNQVPWMWSWALRNGFSTPLVYAIPQWSCWLAVPVLLFLSWPSLKHPFRGQASLVVERTPSLQ